MKIAIAGAGIAGAYLYRLLRDRGEVHVYDRKHTTACGISPCAWGTTGGFNELVERAGLNPKNYELQHLDRVIIDGVEVKLDIVTINKPHLIRDLLGDTAIHNSPLNPLSYERVIDATGVERAFLSRIRNDIVMLCAQSRVYSDKPLESRTNLGHIGYGWCFPLSSNSYHIGCGSLAESSFRKLSDVCSAWYRDGRRICSCSGRIRITCPHYSTPFVDSIAVNGSSVPVWGIGEAIGCVGSLAGDGIVHGMRSAELLVQHWNDPDGYTHAVLKEFEWMKKERHLLDKIARGDRVGLSDAWVFKSNAQRAGMKIGLRGAIELLRRLGTQK